MVATVNHAYNNKAGRKTFKEIKNIGSRLRFTGKEKHRNWIGIIVNQKKLKRIL